MMGLALARALFAHAPIVADIDAGKREAALAAGAGAAFDPADPGARKAMLAATGGVLAACDFVGSERSLQFAMSALGQRRQGRGHRPARRHLHQPVAMLPLKAIAIEGT